jgi:hypothetical protein
LDIQAFGTESRMRGTAILGTLEWCWISALRFMKLLSMPHPQTPMLLRFGVKPTQKSM